MPRRFFARLRRLPAIHALKRAARWPFVLRASLREYLTLRTHRYELAVAAIIKDEARFLDEWLTFHHGVGASHFYLYDNGSTDDCETVLRPWIDRGVVTLIDWPERPGQRSAYLHCVRTHWREARWIAFIDADEFLFSPRQVDIRPILRNYQDLAALYVYRLNFGSSGHVSRPNLPVVEAYTRRELLAATDAGKSIANPRYVRDVPNSHHFKFWKGESRDTNRTLTSNPSLVAPVAGRLAYGLLRIQHYYSRSIEDLTEKTAKGDAFYGIARNVDDYFTWEATMNAEEDLSILPIWREILRQKANRLAAPL